MERLRLDQKNFKVLPLSKCEDLGDFTCGDKELDDFFHREALLYAEQYLGKTHIVLDMNTTDVLAVFTLANDSIKTEMLPKPVKNKVNRPIPNSKRHRSYPGILICRLGISKNAQGLGIGSFVLDYIMAWFSSPDWQTGCRYLLVDAYNKKEVMDFYGRNGFKYMYATEEEEMKTYGIEEGQINARLMYFDLKSYK